MSEVLVFLYDRSVFLSFVRTSTHNTTSPAGVKVRGITEKEPHRNPEVFRQ